MQSNKAAYGDHASKNFRHIETAYKATSKIFLSLLMFLAGGSVTTSAGQQSVTAVRIEILSSAMGRIKVEGRLAAGKSSWSFRNVYARATKLAERIENFTLMDNDGANVPVRQSSAGEYQAQRAATRFRYEMRLNSAFNRESEANVSWMANERALLTLGDLLPLDLKKTKIQFAFPATWSVSTVESKDGQGGFTVDDAEAAVFLAGTDLRERHERIAGMDFAFVTAGEWAFDDKSATSAAVNLLKQHIETMGGVPQRRAMVMLSPFPQVVSANRWNAETRGATVVLISGRAASETAGLSQLSVALAHELFHLWVPNSVALDGEYDWFYEGFTLYQALQTCVRLRLLTFREYLNAVGRAYDVYLSAPQREKLSLLDASRRRWTDATSLVYSKGMLVAFLYDLELRRQTHGKRSLGNVYRELFRRYKNGGSRAEGNTAVLAALSNGGKMKKITERYIEKADSIDLSAIVKPFGLRVDSASAVTYIAPADSINRVQRELLRDLGYNE